MAENHRPPFPPGTSGNPGGRPKDTAEMKAAKADAKAATPRAVAALIAIMEQGENESARVAAANSILDRAFGKPVQAVSNPDGTALDLGGDSARLDILRALAQLRDRREVMVEAHVEEVKALPAKGSEK